MLRIRDPFKQPVRCSQHRKPHLRLAHQRRQSFPMPLPALAKQHRLHPAARLQRFFHQPHALHSHRSIRRRHSTPQRHTKFLQPAVLPASQHLRRPRSCSASASSSASRSHRLSHSASLPNFPQTLTLFYSFTSYFLPGTSPTRCHPEPALFAGEGSAFFFSLALCYQVQTCHPEPLGFCAAKDLSHRALPPASPFATSCFLVAGYWSLPLPHCPVSPHMLIFHHRRQGHGARSRTG